ncbi:MAG: DNA glycosylase AlkZ-like family protein [Bacteroidota bacterium]
MFAPSLIRRLLVERQYLERRRESSAAALVQHLEAVQVDPVNLIARNQELALFSRLSTYRAGQADYYHGSARLFEYIAGNRALLPLDDLPLFVPFMRRREARHQETLRSLQASVRQVLRELERQGPLTSRRIVCAEKTHGYWENAHAAPRTKETSHALQLLWEAGRVTVVGRAGGESVFDLAERAFPADLLRRGEEMSLAEARRLLREKYYRAFGIFDAQHAGFAWQRLTARERAEAIAADEARGVIERLPVAGVRRSYWAPAGTGEALAASAQTELKKEARFLPPLDNLLWRRERLEDLFGFNYRWEIYTPARKRTGGPYTMPILYGSDLVGRLNARFERKTKQLLVEGITYEPGIRGEKSLTRAVAEELDRLREFLGAARVNQGPS